MQTIKIKTKLIHGIISSETLRFSTFYCIQNAIKDMMIGLCRKSNINRILIMQSMALQG